MMKTSTKNCPGKDYYLVTTEHLKEGLWFKEDEDYKVGMNHVASVSFLCGILVLAFVLMSNHVHFVLYCTYEEAQRFIDEFRRVYSEYVSKKYGIKELLRKNRAVIERISPEDESFERAAAYTQMNPPAANICLNPYDYPWGTGSTFFKVRPAKGVRLGTFSRRASAKLLHTKRALPADWIVGEDGYILPESYVPVTLVESIFRTPKRMNFFLQNSSKAKRKSEFQGNDLPSFRDQVLYAAMADLCRSFFGKNEVSSLDDDQRGEMVRQLRRRFSADIHQIARVTSLRMDEVARYLDVP